MAGQNREKPVGAGLPTIRAELLRSQLRPVLALAVAAATLIALLIVAQYAWLRLQATNPLDEIEVDDLRQVLRAATPEQLPVLARWVASFGLGMAVDTRVGVPPGQARLPDGRQIALSDVLSIVVGGQRVNVTDNRPLGATPATWRSAIEGLPDRGTLRLTPVADGGTELPQAWPALLIRLDAQRVAVLASPNYSLAAGEVAELVLVAFALTGAGVAGFVALFLFALRRRFADRSAERLSAPVERLAAAVRVAATDCNASRRVTVEAPAEVAQLASDFNLMQENLAKTLADREHVIEGQRELVASLSHELRTPLAVLHGHAEVLSREAISAPSALVMLRQIEDLHRLLSDLLDMARLESIEATLVVEDVALAPVIDEMLERFGAAGWRQGVLLRPAPTVDRLLVAQADPRWLRQIVANLLSNAIRHTPPGGLVTLGTQRHGAHVQLVIEDTGSGLDAARAKHDMAGRGAGIGLRVVRRLLAAMRGSLLLEATDEGGTRAAVRLSAATPS
jgi:signal transduction histidine kinase